MSRRRRGFTLVELIVYLGLMTMGLLLVGAIELTAQRAADMQQALIEVQLAADAFLGHLRRDVEAARRVTREGQELVLELQDGRRVRWLPGVREELAAPGLTIPARREVHPAVTSWELRLEVAGAHTRVTVDAKLEARTRGGSPVVRRRSRTATTRLEVTGE